MKTKTKDNLKVEHPIDERIDVTASVEVIDVAKASSKLEYGEIEVVISNSGTDRHGEQILLEGIDLKQIKRNPTVLWAHSYSALPIGKLTKIWKTGDDLMGRIKFSTDEYEFAHTVYKLILNGSLNAVSIGGIVKEWNDDYTIVKKLEMIELSVVPVGAHPDALVAAKSLDMKPEELEKQFEDFFQKAIVDKYKTVGDDELNNHIQSLKRILSILEQSQEQREPKETKETKKVKLIVLKQAAGEAAYHAGQINKITKFKLKEK